MATGAISSTSGESDEEESDDSDDDYEDASSDGRDTVISLGDNQSIVTLIDKKEAEDSPEHRFGDSYCYIYTLMSKLTMYKVAGAHLHITRNLGHVYWIRERTMLIFTALAEDA